MNDFVAKQDAICMNSAIDEVERAGAPLESRVNRRDFLAGLGCGGAALLLSPLQLPTVLRKSPEDLLLCVGSFGLEDEGTLHTVSVRNGVAKVLHSTSAVRPSAVVQHPFHAILYVASDVGQFGYHPRGAVETFAVNQATGAMERVGRQPLSLSATRPRSLAVSADGASLLVAAYGGGSYNALPIDASGVPGAPSAILKQVGRGEYSTEQASSHPAHVLIHPETGLVLAADYGTDRLDILTPHGGADATTLQVAARVPCPAGSGPSEIAMHRSGRLLVVRYALRPSLAAFRITGNSQLIRAAETRLKSVPTAIFFHPDRDVLYCALNRNVGDARLAAFRIDSSNGTLRLLREINIPAAEGRALYLSQSTLWLATERGLMAAELDRATGEPHEVLRVANIPDIRSLAVLRLA